MADATPFALVLPGPKTPKGSVALFEAHYLHPKTTEFPEGGQAFVANTKPRIVARTPQVNIRIADGRLVEVDPKALYRGKDFSRLPHLALDPVTEAPLEPGAFPPVDPAQGVGTGEAPSAVAAFKSVDPDLRG